jgi:2-amino-4-hydroxy-6-hydroxymethyldihydropteridine diphosphokinase
MQLGRHTKRYNRRRALQKDENAQDGLEMILVSIGANLPAADGSSPLTTCRAAAAALDEIPGLFLIGLSRWFRTAPMPRSGQPDYINGVARLRGAAEPGALLAHLQAIEARAGRQRSERDAARTLDLDILAMGPQGGLCRAAPDPVVPHPRAHLRGFVLAPLLDVAPDWVHPMLGRTAAALLAALPPQGVQPLPGHKLAGA